MNTFQDWFEQQKRQFEEAKAARVALKPATPTYSAANSVPAEEAREKFDQVFDEFLRVTTAWNESNAGEEDDEEDDEPFEDFAEDNTKTPHPPVHAARITTGSGKTQRAAARIARFIREGKLAPGWSVLYLVPRHELGEHIDDPNIPGNTDLPKDDRTRMCIDLESLSRAEKCGMDITKACCKYKKLKCKFYDDGCGYQQQFPDEQPQVWIAAHEMLHYAQKRFGKIAFIVIDESFWKRGVYGVEARGDETRGISLEDMALDMPSPGYRSDLIEILQAHSLGGLEHARLSKQFDRGHCKFMIGVEWERVNRLKLTPRMSTAQIKQVEKEIPKARTARRMVGVWGALRELVGDPKVEVSGRLIGDENDAGQRVLKVRGVKPVRKSRQLPTFIMDATLPDISILRAWFPQVEIVADIDVAMPEHVHVTQILGAPVSKRRLFRWRKKEPKDGARNLKAIRRLVLQWWLEHERRPMLVICQQAVEEWLKKAGLPDGIKVEHYNNISGLDRYKDVGSLLLIGRTIPWPARVEAYAGALSGHEPIKVPPKKWYQPVARAIRMADGSGIAVEGCDQHPDPLGEHVRFQICEGEMLQALGRARAINRTAESPLQIGIVADVVLPITVNKVEVWQAPSRAMEPAEEGVMLFSPHDMAEVWPWIWKSVDEAKKTLAKIKASARRAGTRCQNGIYDSYIPFRHGVAVLYQRAGRNQKLRPAAFDLLKQPIPRKWFEEKWKAIAALLHILREREIKPLAGNGKAVADAAVKPTAATVRALVDQLPPECELLRASEAQQSKAFDAKMWRIAAIDERLNGKQDVA
jgi:hypothetical protein